MKKFLLPLVFLLLASVGFAASDSVMLVSDVTSVDMLIAKAAGERTGIPVLVLENGALMDDIKTEISSLGVKTVILVGGPAVISEEIEAELAGKYEVVRLWGNERTGTAVGVAKYFWYGGADCVVLADDTKDSAADTELQTEASASAAAEGCPFFPVPKGTVPAEVLDVVGQLGAVKAKFVGLGASQEFKLKFANMQMEENTGDISAIRAKVQAEIEAKASDDLRLLVIAAPNWKDVLGQAGYSGLHTIVRIVNSADEVPSLVDLVNTKNITYVGVVGEPTLADEVTTAFGAAGINVTKTSGTASEVARKSLEETRKRWEEREKELRTIELKVRSQIKANLENYLDRLENVLNEVEAYLAQLPNATDPAAIDAVQTKIDNAKNQLTAIQTYIDNSNYLTARKRIARLMNEIDVARWKNRIALGINQAKEVASEENSLEATEASVDVTSLEGRLGALREKCNAESIESLVNKTRAMYNDMQTAKANGEYTKASRLAVQIRTNLAQANALSNVCMTKEKIASKLVTAVSRSVKNAETLRGKVESQSV